MRVPNLLVRNERRLRFLASGVGALVLLGCASRALIKADDGDFALHRETGRRFLAGEFLYAGAHDFAYPPLLGLVFAPAALMRLPIAKTVYYVVGTAALVLLLWTLQRLERAGSAARSEIFWTTTLAVTLSIQFIMRDQAEGGFNSAITALVWLGIYYWTKRRDILAGASIGLATAIKCTPALFIVYFAWKRQWTMALCAVAATVVFSLLPALRLGPTGWKDHVSAWIANATHAAARSGTPSDVVGSPKIRNLSLRHVIPAYFDWGHADEPTTSNPPLSNNVLGRRVADVVMVALLLALAVWSRHPPARRDDPHLKWEMAAVGVLTLLFSPVAWTQHCVALIPACYFAAALVVRRESLPYGIWFVLFGFFLVCCLAGRDIVPHQVDEAITAWGIATFCMVGLFAILFAGPRLEQSS